MFRSQAAPHCFKGPFIITSRGTGPGIVRPREAGFEIALGCAQAWLNQTLRSQSDASGIAPLSLVATRGHILQGLCAQLGVDESTGGIAHTLAGTEEQQLHHRVDVRF